jgi:hypothetical protein
MNGSKVGEKIIKSPPVQYIKKYLFSLIGYSLRSAITHQLVETIAAIYSNMAK